MEHPQEDLSLHWHAPFGVRANYDTLVTLSTLSFVARVILHAEFTFSMYPDRLRCVGKSTTDFKATAYGFTAYLSLCSSKLKGQHEISPINHFLWVI